MGKRFFASAALSAVAVFLSLCVVEIGLRLYSRSTAPLAVELRSWDPYLVKVEPHGQFGYRPRPGAVFLYSSRAQATENRQGWRGPAVAVPKPSGTLRVVLLGESTTHGFGVGDNQTIDRYLEKDLRQALADRRIEVVNLAFDGYDAYQIWQRFLSDGVKLQPDAVVLNTGINDVRNARFPNLADPDPRTLIWEGEMRRLRWEAEHGGPAFFTRVKHYLYLARFPGAIRGIIALQSTRPKAREVVYWDAAAMFSRNVERIADETRRLKLPLVLSTPPSVLTRPGAPEMQSRSYWIVNPTVTQGYRDTLAARLVDIAKRRAADGVQYQAHDLPVEDFLDDCHLTPAGNRAMAADFAAVLIPLLRSSVRQGAAQH